MEAIVNIEKLHLRNNFYRIIITSFFQGIDNVLINLLVHRLIDWNIISY